MALKCRPMTPGLPATAGPDGNQGPANPERGEESVTARDGVTRRGFWARRPSPPLRLVLHCDRSRAKFQPAYEPQVDIPGKPREQRRPVARDLGVYHELVLVDQPQLRERQRQRHTLPRQSLAGLPLELPNGLAEIAAHGLCIPVDVLQGARHHVLLAALMVRAKGSVHSGIRPERSICLTNVTLDGWRIPLACADGRHDGVPQRAHLRTLPASSTTVPSHLDPSGATPAALAFQQIRGSDPGRQAAGQSQERISGRQ